MWQEKPINFFRDLTFPHIQNTGKSEEPIVFLPPLSLIYFNWINLGLLVVALLMNMDKIGATYKFYIR